MPNPSSASPSPLPPPAPAATRRRRRRWQLLPPSSSTSGASATSSSSSSSSSGLSFSFPSFSPAPSPFHHRFLSPLRASAVPFSWEHRPGIPKTPARQTARVNKAAKAPPLPLPPSILSSKVGAAKDPFSTAADYFIVPENAKAARRRRRRQQRRPRQPALAATLTDWLAVLSFYRSCTRPHDCLAGTQPPRPRAPAKTR
ncbi:COPII coat assembly protein sec16-like [Phragmites australis]|uniref:COPII coat assembly protein sec16-like n=1 Tax=Phragmites australis TaxID=29695 RepID=UPI002D78F009|nr:COPII coat assembly protein sec16-like [Phragmites australis]